MMGEFVIFLVELRDQFVCSGFIKMDVSFPWHCCHALKILSICFVHGKLTSQININVGDYFYLELCHSAIYGRMLYYHVKFVIEKYEFQGPILSQNASRL